MQRRFQQIDVFGAKPFAGNPLAVVLDSDGLTTEEMLRITRWMNLSETAFLLPPKSESADYRVRIFTPQRELPFAGHPTLGSCHAWLTAGGRPKQPGAIVQECGVGLIRLQRDAAGLAFAAPPLLRSGPIDDQLLQQVVAVLGIDRQQIVDASWADNGPGWIGVLLADAAAVLAIEPDFSRFVGDGHLKIGLAGPYAQGSKLATEPPTDDAGLDIGLVGPYPSGSECAFEVRALFGDGRGGMVEDPVTGSLNASLAQWLLATGRAAAPFVTSQGTRLGREGRPRISQDTDGAVWVGGATVTCIAGEIDA